MSTAKDRRKINAEAEAERMRRERERREFKEAQELESLRRAFKRIDKKGDGKVDAEELMAELEFLGHKVKRCVAELIIWEVDDDADEAVDWEEFRTMFYRIRDDTTGCEPRKLFNMVEFLMHDKNYTGSIDLDECVTLLYARCAHATPIDSPGARRDRGCCRRGRCAACPAGTGARLSMRACMRCSATTITRRTSHTQSSSRSRSAPPSCRAALGSSRAPRWCRR